MDKRVKIFVGALALGGVAATLTIGFVALLTHLPKAPDPVGDALQRGSEAYEAWRTRRHDYQDQCDAEFHADVDAFRRAIHVEPSPAELGRAVGALRATLMLCIAPDPAHHPHPSNLLVDLDEHTPIPRLVEIARTLDAGWAVTPVGKPWRGALP